MEKWHECKYCSYRTMVLSLLTNHMRNKHPEGLRTDRCNCTNYPLQSFKCSQCNFSTNLVMYHRRHVQRGHAQIKNNILRYQCKSCNFNSHSKLFFETHRCTVNKSRYYCMHCSHFSFYNADLKRHIIFKHTPLEDIQHFYCGHCDYKSKTKRLLQSHIISKHMVPEYVHWFKCEHCEYKCKQKDPLRRHIFTKHLDLEHIQWFECENFKSKRKGRSEELIISKHFSEPTLPIQVALENIAWYQCENCDFKSKRSDGLKAHMITKHLTDKSVPRFQCEQCHYRCHLKAYLKRHYKVKHPNTEPILRFQCGHCGHKCRLKANLQTHISRRHTDLKGNSLRCQLSPRKEIRTKMRKIRKPRTARPIKGFQCAHCEYRTKDKTLLERHIAVRHTAPENAHWFQCERCLYRTIHSRYLQRHVKCQHSPSAALDWFQCAQCDYKSKYKSNLKAHIRRYHARLESEALHFERDSCGSKFKTKLALNVHLRQSRVTTKDPE